MSDHLGSPRLVLEVNTGTVVQKMDYDEYGRVLLDTNPGFQPFGFAGGLYDRDTQLVQFGLREYDPETGRWTSKDPIGFDGGDANLYKYCGNDPVNYVDPTGLSLNALKTIVGWVSPVDPFAIWDAYNDYYNRMIEGDYWGAAKALGELALENPFTGKAKKAGKAVKGFAKNPKELVPYHGKGGHKERSVANDQRQSGGHTKHWQKENKKKTEQSYKDNKIARERKQRGQDADEE